VRHFVVINHLTNVPLGERSLPLIIVMIRLSPWMFTVELPFGVDFMANPAMAYGIQCLRSSKPTIKVM
jgi:hypothetical protein